MNAAVSLNDILIRADVWRGALGGAEVPALSSGFAALDAELPGGGWPRGALTELLTDEAGAGECALLMPVLNTQRAEARWSVLIAPPHGLHAPAWAAQGVDCSRLAIVAPQGRRDLLWATEQALSSGAAGMVVCWAKQLDPAQVRRLQVAVAGSGALAFLFRPLRAWTEASAAPLRLLLSSGQRGELCVNLLKRRGPPCGRTLHLKVPRPLAWREVSDDHDAHETSVARPVPAVFPARSQRPVAVA